jgi:hypothetical protein
MKILFVENRYKTVLWEIIGGMYQQMGHEIHWIVQNPLFKPSLGKINVLPFPRKLNFEKHYTGSIKKIIQADRGINYFGIKSDDFIFWYQQKIEQLIENIRPDLVFGESTLFHELLVIDSCKKRHIKYLHPSSCRYPTNRFSFYLYDTLIPYGESGEQFSDQEAGQTVESIAKRKILPDYMQVLKHKIGLGYKLQDRLKLSWGYLIGERYNTPSPINKVLINRYYRKNIEVWEKNAKSIEELKDCFYLLYPMQMQPEANIDVWGSPYNDQAAIVSWIIEQLQDGELLIIKPNPKSKYEISDNLISIIQRNSDKVIPLKHSTKIDELWPFVDLVVTVTGTISIECIFDNKPVVMFGQGIQSSQKNCLTVDLDVSLRQIIFQVKVGSFPKLSEQDKKFFLQTLVNSSFKGVNGDGLYNRYYLKNENLKSLCDAFKQVLNFCE